MATDGYRNIRLPEALLDRVAAFVSDNGDGFQTVPEVVKQAIREFLDSRQT